MQIMHNIFISFIISYLLKSSWIIKHDLVFLNNINIVQINNLMYSSEAWGLHAVPGDEGLYIRQIASTHVAYKLTYVMSNSSKH